MGGITPRDSISPSGNPSLPPHPINQSTETSSTLAKCLSPDQQSKDPPMAARQKGYVEFGESQQKEF